MKFSEKTKYDPKTKAFPLKSALHNALNDVQCWLCDSPHSFHQCQKLQWMKSVCVKQPNVLKHFQQMILKKWWCNQDTAWGIQILWWYVIAGYLFFHILDLSHHFVSTDWSYGALLLAHPFLYVWLSCFVHYWLVHGMTPFILCRSYRIRTTNQQSSFSFHHSKLISQFLHLQNINYFCSLPLSPIQSIQSPLFSSFSRIHNKMMIPFYKILNHNILLWILILSMMIQPMFNILGLMTQIWVIISPSTHPIIS